MAKKPEKKSAEGPVKKVVARNRRARHEFHLELTVEAGIVLVGSEVKTLREGRVAMDQAWARIEGGELWLHELNVPEYGSASWTNHAPKRKRKLLLHRREIRKLDMLLRVKGKTIVPLEIYFNEKGRAKVLLAVASGKKQHDKRQDLAKRDAEREMERARRP